MTAPQARPPQILPRPACTPAAVRAVLAANAGDAVLRRYDQDLDMAFEQAREQGDLTPLVQTVRRCGSRQTPGAILRVSGRFWAASILIAAKGRRLLSGG